MRIASFVLVIGFLLTSLSPLVWAGDCFTTVNASAQPSVDFVTRLKVSLKEFKDIPPHLDLAGATAQFDELKRLYRGEPDDLDSLSVEMRSQISPAVFFYQWKESDGTLQHDENELAKQLKLFARVLAQKDGVQLVALPPGHLNWDRAEKIPIRLFFVAHLPAPLPPNSSDLAAWANTILPQIYAASAAASVKMAGLLNEMRVKVFKTGTQPYHLPPTDHLVWLKNGAGAFHVEEALELYRDDLLRFPSFENALAAFR